MPADSSSGMWLISSSAAVWACAAYPSRRICAAMALAMTDVRRYARIDCAPLIQSYPGSPGRIGRPCPTMIAMALRWPSIGSAVQHPGDGSQMPARSASRKKQ
ncbi:hypothetical protein [Candidatus Poriferisodalis sp.]|uniref:hypothetical protein n=1 Tax=Candidatus Poriferisodalis sp. TaxID=3101277 RepID=UPI003B52617D